MSAPTAASAAVPPRFGLRFPIVFVVLMVALFALELTAPVQARIVAPWTALVARASVAMVRLFDASTIASGNVLASTRNGFSISIEAGCNGVEAALVLVAAICAFRAPWHLKAAGIAGGIFAVQALNVLRVISLFYLGQWSLRAFEWAHLYVWQALIIVDVLVVWLLWLRWAGSRRIPGAAAA